MFLFDMNYHEYTMNLPDSNNRYYYLLFIECLRENDREGLFPSLLSFCPFGTVLTK